MNNIFILSLIQILGSFTIACMIYGLIVYMPKMYSSHKWVFVTVALATLASALSALYIVMFHLI